MSTRFSLPRMHELGQRHALRLHHGVGQQPVGLLAALVGAEVVGLLEVDRIHLGERDELGDVDHARGLALERLQLFLGELHVLVLGELVALDQRAALDDLVAGGAELLLLMRPPHFWCSWLNETLTRGRGREHLDRDRDQAERDGSPTRWNVEACCVFLPRDS